MTPKEFFQQHPDAHAVLQVGDELFLPIHMGSAQLRASQKGEGVTVEVIANPKFVKAEETPLLKKEKGKQATPPATEPPADNQTEDSQNTGDGA